MPELPENLTPVRTAHVFDEARLADYMRAHVDGFRGPLRGLRQASEARHGRRVRQAEAARHHLGGDWG